MTQPTPPAPPPDASSSQDDAWSCLLSLETHIQLTQAFLTSHTAKLTGLCQTTEVMSLSLQALLKHLPLTPTPPPGPPAAAARFSSAPSSEVSAPHSKIPCFALSDIFYGDCRSVESNISVVALDTMPEMISLSSNIQTPSPAKVSAGDTSPNPCLQIPAWGHHLPHYYIVASTPSANSLKLQVEIETMDTQQTQSVVALLDSGAIGLFLHKDYVQ
ncbi:hypothetical protein E4T56_gene7090 [Termitomyces sp. T112]|nr:hypothetical protein E4T56_gene7090 [Termitomyces sp. T112]